MANHVTNYTMVDPQMGTLNIRGRQKPSDYHTFFKRGLKFRANDVFLGGGEFVVVPVTADNTTGGTITSTSSGEVVTITETAHGRTVGQRVVLSGQIPDKYVGDFIIETVPTANTFTVRNKNQTGITSATTVGTYVASPLSAGQIVEMSSSVASSVLLFTAAPWAGTANTGLPLGVVLFSALKGELAIVQTSGLCQAVTAGTPAVNNSVYYGATAGSIRPTANAGAQVLGARYMTAKGATVLSELQESYIAPNRYSTSYDPQITFVCDSDKALIYINSPHSQSAIL